MLLLLLLLLVEEITGLLGADLSENIYIYIYRLSLTFTVVCPPHYLQRRSLQSSCNMWCLHCREDKCPCSSFIHCVTVSWCPLRFLAGPGRYTRTAFDNNHQCYRGTLHTYMHHWSVLLHSIPFPPLPPFAMHHLYDVWPLGDGSILCSHWSSRPRPWHHTSDGHCYWNDSHFHSGLHHLELSHG